MKHPVSKRQVIWSAAPRGLLIMVLAGVFLLAKQVAYSEQKTPAVRLDQRGEKIFHKQDLAVFNGSDGSKPIYIGLNGLVYDVSAGRDYYKVGGVYHFLAGRDASDELNLIGGGIIRRKYPVVGVLVD